MTHVFVRFDCAAKSPDASDSTEIKWYADALAYWEVTSMLWCKDTYAHVLYKCVTLSMCVGL